ncbi:MAG: 30S ribosomal protein S9 [Candidatus Hydrothermarchaeota archaeon]
MSKNIVISVGKRKTSIARAVIRKGNGRIRINKIPVQLIEPELARLNVMEPVLLAKDVVNNVDIDVNVRGGGVMSRAEACKVAIARGLVDWTNDISLKNTFLEYDRNLLIWDKRRTEPKKYGGRKARARRQKSYR